MLRLLVAALLCMGILSCEKPAPAKEKEISAKASENAELANAQFQLAKSYLATGSPEKALPYLRASLANEKQKRTAALLKKTLKEKEFRVPTYRLDHPLPISHFLETTDAVFVALGGATPTLVRWDLTPEPAFVAMLFPAETSEISHLSLSRGGQHILVQRGDTNLLCHAETLKPITNLGTFPTGLAPENLQPFSENNLLVANPTSSARNIIWHIRDTATGEVLRSESFSQYPAPVSAVFEETELVITLEDRTTRRLPIVGDVRITSPPNPGSRPRIVPPPPSGNFVVDGNALVFQQPIPAPAGAELDLKFLSGYSLDAESQELLEIPVPDRLAALSAVFPEKIPATFRIFTSEQEVLGRLALGFPEKFPELAAAEIAHAGIVWQTFDSGDPAAISAIISALPQQGLPTATALFLALKSKDAELIEQVLEVAKNVPPVISQLATGTSNFTAEEFAKLRREQDWAGYEAPDFTPIVAEMEATEADATANLRLGSNPTEEELATFIAYLFSPEAEKLHGSEKLAAAALSAAGKLAHAEAQAISSQQLAAIADRLGADEAAVLRVRATAQTTLGDFEGAHQSWIALITNRPEATHLASDYSEAAYTAFENANPAQAMEILNTGLFRFPNDTAFAIRAGWISLLTDHPEEALRYLERATELGLPKDEIENTTALLAIVHTQLGDPEKALAFLEQLKAIDEKWADPATIEDLTWPEPLKASLRQLIWQP